MKQKKIRIGAIDYTIEMVTDLRDGDRGLNGWIRYNDSKVMLDDEMEPQAEYITLWQEILHGLLTQAGMAKQDERIVEVLSHGIVMVIRDNPWLVNHRTAEAVTTSEEANDE